VQRVKDKVAATLVTGNKDAWPEVRDQLNRLLRGWTSYFGYGSRLKAYRAVENHAYDHVRNFLVKRHKVEGRGTRCFSRPVVFGKLGVMALRSGHLGSPPKAPR
jgi:RNA-directed DNA polymerase